MARVKLMAGIESISGKVGNLIFKTYRNGKVRAFPAAHRPRRSKVRPEEVARRKAFAEISREVARRRAAGDGRSQKEIWREVQNEIGNSTMARLRQDNGRTTGQE